jgi:hypothetical protein
VPRESSRAPACSLQRQYAAFESLGLELFVNLTLLPFVGALDQHGISFAEW